jgi:preprotein translocase subunit SecG
VTLFLTVVHVIVCVFLIIVVLLQRGKGAEIGAVFGGGGGGTLFGSRGAGNFLTRLTTGAALIFMLTSLSLAYFGDTGTRSTLFDEEPEASAEAEPSPFAEPADPATTPDAAAEADAGDTGGFVEVPQEAADEVEPDPAPEAEEAEPNP